MKRRTYLALLGTGGTVGTAGCLSSDAGSTAASTPPTARSATTSPPESPRTTVPSPDVATPAPGECDAASLPSPSTSEGLPDPKPYPEKPAELEKATVQPFLEEYETAYRYNHRLAEIATTDHCLSYLDASVTESTVTTTENGAIGEVSTRASFTGRTCPGTTGTDTRTPLPHADLGVKSAQYHVTERFLLRNETVLECWS